MRAGLGLVAMMVFGAAMLSPIQKANASETQASQQLGVTQEEPRLQVFGYFEADYLDPETATTHHLTESSWWFDVEFRWGLPQYEAHCYQNTDWANEAGVDEVFDHPIWLVEGTCDSGLYLDKSTRRVITRYRNADGTFSYN